MNAYDLAEGILAIEERIFLTSKEHKLFQNSANMLRQQADRIVELQEVNGRFADLIQSLREEVDKLREERHGIK